MGERLPNSPSQKVEFNNRAARRHAPEVLERNSFRGQWNRLAGQLRESAGGWDRVNNEQGHNRTKVIYQGEPFIFDFLAVRSELPAFLQKAYRVNLEEPGAPYLADLDKFDMADLFSQELRGVTLEQIGKMPLPLDLGDIKRINSLFRGPFRFKKLTNSQLLVKESAIFLANQVHARPDLGMKVPQKILPLYQRLTDYFDYYTSLVTDFSLSDDEEVRLLVNLLWANMLPAAVGCYLPGRLGITPSSAIKLYRQRIERIGIPSHFRFSWKLPVGKMENASYFAFPKNGLPADLAVYGHYDEEMDGKVAVAVADYYKDQELDWEEWAKAYQTREELLEKLRPYRKLLRGDISRSEGRHMELAMPESHLVSRLTATWQYKQTLMFILHFSHGPMHLTLELDEDNNLYGLPPRLVKDNPRLADLLLVDVVTPFLAELQRWHPEVERRTESVKIPTLLRGEEQLVPVGEATGQLVGERVRKVAKSARPPRVILTPIMQILAKAPELPQRHEQSRRRFNVIYSRRRIVEAMGSRVSDEKIDRIMEAIRRFEFGAVQIHHLSWSGGNRESVRVGDLRVILKPAGGNVYTVEKVGHRRDVYKGYGDSAQFQGW